MDTHLHWKDGVLEVTAPFASRQAAIEAAALDGYVLQKHFSNHGRDVIFAHDVYYELELEDKLYAVDEPNSWCWTRLRGNVPQGPGQFSEWALRDGDA